MSINVSSICSDYHFEITQPSYIGKPANNTVMYATKKIEHQLKNLESVKHCLVFVEDTIDVPSVLKADHCFILTPNPQLAYTKFTQTLNDAKEKSNRMRKYILTKDGYYLGENVVLGDNIHIEPNCFIGHDVTIGDNATIRFGTIIRDAVIGDNFIANENAAIGTYAFTMARDENNNLVRIPTLGGVRIGNNVEVGAFNNISCGTAGDTVLCNYVKLDAYTHIGHDAFLDNNVEIPAGVIVGGFDKIEAGAFVGLNATLRNRIVIGANAIIGMGAVVTKDVPANTTVVGNPAKPIERK